MKKITSLFTLILGFSLFGYAEFGEVVFDIDEKHDFAYGGIMQKVSNNGKYVVGSSEMTSSAFYYDVDKDELILLNPEINNASTDEAHLWLATASDVSDAGIIVGSYSFEEMVNVPAIYNIATKTWTPLPLNPELENEKLQDGNANGEATSITSDGKYISGYINSKLDNSKVTKTVMMYTACVWVNKGTAENPAYELQLPLENDHTKLLTQGDWPFQMSNDGKYIGGLHTNYSGCFNPVYWVNKGEGEILERHFFDGMDKDSWDYENPDGVTDQEKGGALPGQYWWDGRVMSISNSGEWIVGYTTFNGTGYDNLPEGSQDLPNAVGFKYNTVTKVLEDSLFVLPTFVFDDGETIAGDPNMTRSNIFHSSDDKLVQCGAKFVVNPAVGLMNVPYVLVEGYVANEIVKAELDVNVYASNKTLYVDGEFTSIEIFSVLGSHVATFNNDSREFNLSDLNNGVYMVRIVNGNQFTTKKINL